MKKNDIVVIFPAVVVLLLTHTIWYLTGYPEGLFLSRSIRGILTRFALITIMLLVPLPVIPRLLAWLSNMAGGETLLGQLVATGTTSYEELNKSVMILLRPLQGMGLSMIFAERILLLMEFSTGVSPSRVFIRLTLFFLGSILVSLLLSTVWAFDDLGIKSHNKKNGEVRLFGNTVGVVLPLIAGILGVSTLFQRDTVAGALTDIFGIGMVLYPPYSIFAFIHYEFFRRRSITLMKKLSLKRIRTNVW